MRYLVFDTSDLTRHAEASTLEAALSKARGLATFSMEIEITLECSEGGWDRPIGFVVADMHGNAHFEPTLAFHQTVQDLMREAEVAGDFDMAETCVRYLEDEGQEDLTLIVDALDNADAMKD